MQKSPLPTSALVQIWSSRAARNGRIGARLERQSHGEAFRLLAAASEQDLIAANRRFDLVKRHLEGERAHASVPARTLRFWMAQYRLAKEQYGNGYVGLLPKTGSEETAPAGLPEESRNLLTEFVENDYENLKQKTKSGVLGGAEAKMRRAGVDRAELCHVLSLPSASVRPSNKR